MNFSSLSDEEKFWKQAESKRTFITWNQSYKIFLNKHERAQLMTFVTSGQTKIPINVIIIKFLLICR